MKKFKGFALFMSGFFIAMGISVLGFNIETSVQNLVQYIQKIIITSDGTNSGIEYVNLNKNGSGKVFVKNDLDVGTVNIKTGLNVNGNSIMTGNLRVNGGLSSLTLGVNGNSDFGNINLNGDLIQTGGNVKINGNLNLSGDLLLDSANKISNGKIEIANYTIKNLGGDDVYFDINNGSVEFDSGTVSFHTSSYVQFENGFMLSDKSSSSWNCDSSRKGYIIFSGDSFFGCTGGTTWAKLNN